MSLRIHLVHPGISFYGFGASGRPGEPSLIHHGLAMVAATARQAGHQVTLTDMRACSGWDEVRDRLREDAPDVVGITMMSCEFDTALEVARIAKEERPETVVVVGGPHPSIAAEELEPHPEVDVIFKGEGEVTFPALLEQIERGERLERVVQGEAPDLDALPFPARDLFPSVEVPDVSLYFPQPFVTIITGRGCRYNCAFCQPAERRIFGRRVRRRSVAHVMRELEQLRQEIGFRSLMIHDDCLTEDPEWVGQFCDAYIAAGFDAPFVCQSRADLICKNRDMIAKMRRAGLDTLMIGFESGSDRVLRFLRKGTTVEQNLEAARICRSLGIRIFANYMVGIPTETQDEVRETVAMIREIRPDFCSPAYYTPHPGSDLFDYCLEHDLSLITDHAGYTRYPTEPKIRGIDYEFIEKMVDESRGARRYHLFDRLSRASRRLHVPEPVRRLAKRLIVR
ncbi:MAG: B12-binding domain-containing radical SAM protein [candidate division WS1 bacterium]|jgi:radical SAM superfamily enzyme YgiQ (UPF0313 family)|nr:B12-binding domain-containing radical SAM protein [candidate division WS1 bacterium]